MRLRTIANELLSGHPARPAWLPVRSHPGVSPWCGGIVAHVPRAVTFRIVLVQRFRKTNHMLTAFQIVIPGRRSEAEVSPESITPVSGYGFRALDPRPSADSLAPE